jgi:hypothetical protein
MHITIHMYRGTGTCDAISIYSSLAYKRCTPFDS